ncbi:hypothetical protein Enr13x_18850 [Stieleria neptunia]|uniref:Uncharacterized protein n=1 Tax=Stieleria neptunia TaxID=2527979 RepID=A0A518HMG0_9BACT|nr:hypothetical protein Enr13x_18850 [Stieleria neptunia]
MADDDSRTTDRYGAAVPRMVRVENGASVPSMQAVPTEERGASVPPMQQVQQTSAPNQSDGGSSSGTGSS